MIIGLVIYVIENDTDTFREGGDAELLTLVSVLKELGLIRLNSFESSVVVDSDAQFFSALWDWIVLFSFSLIGFCLQEFNSIFGFDFCSWRKNSCLDLLGLWL